MKKLANNTKWMLAITGVLMVIVGIMVVMHPLAAAWTSAKIVGWFLIAMAIFEAVAFVVNFKRFYAGWLLVRALATGMVGALLAFRPLGSIELLTIIFGIWVIVDGAAQFANAFIVRSIDEKNWLWPVVGGIIEVIAGVVMLFHTGLSMIALTYAIAIAAIVDGVVMIVDAFKIQKALNEAKRWEKAIEESFEDMQE